MHIVNMERPVEKGSESHFPGGRLRQSVQSPATGVYSVVMLRREGNLSVKLREEKADGANRPFYKYSVDVVSGWLYYTPTGIVQEMLAGKDMHAIVATRTLGLVAHATTIRPIGLVRNMVAAKLNVTKSSPFLDKVKVNLIGVTPIQSVTYSAMLLGGMAWAGVYDWEASARAWVITVGLGVLHSFPYGWFQDRVRRFFNVQPAIKIDATKPEERS
jgi:hypothetical protein